MKYILQVNQIEAFAHLGVSEDENNFKQKIRISFSIYDNVTPAACLSDNIRDTNCYGSLCDEIQKFVENNKIKLLEHLTYELYKLIKTYTTKNIKVTVSKSPPIKNVKEASFSIDDE